ncbi:MAG: Mov34/MPN/PAD-1 family protein [Burkholderiaceae bacterium]
MKWTDQSPELHDARWPAAGEFAPPSRQLCAAGPQAPDPDHQAWMPPAVHRAVLDHLRAAPVEQGGLLLGRVCRRPGDDAMLLIVEEAVAARQSQGTGFSLRMAAGVWSDAGVRLNRLQERDPAARVLGWYHSHPGLGAFFSATDCRTQASFFHHRWSLGWVIDPLDDSHACFVGPDSRPIAAWLLGSGTRDEPLPA